MSVVESLGTQLATINQVAKQLDIATARIDQNVAGIPAHIDKLQEAVRSVAMVATPQVQTVAPAPGSLATVARFIDWSSVAGLELLLACRLAVDNTRILDSYLIWLGVDGGKRCK